MYKIWNGEKLNSLIAIDAETEVAPFTTTPAIATFQAYDGEQGYYVRIDEVPSFFEVNDKAVFIAHNIPFDWDVLVKNCSIDMHTLLESDRLRDTQILYKLVKLADVGTVPFQSSLAHVAEELLGVVLDKNEDIRCTFDQYIGRPIEDISEEHLEYGIKDVIYTHEIYTKLMDTEHLRNSATRLSEQIQIAGAVALLHIYKNGIGFDLEGASKKLDELKKQLGKHADVLACYSWVRGQKGLKEKFDYIIDYIGLTLPRTESGNYSSKEADLIKYKDNHFIEHYLEYISTEKTISFIKEIVKAHS